VNFIGRYNKLVARTPKLAIIAILLTTSFFGYFAAGVSFESSEEDFRPDSEVALANDYVTTTFGGQSESFAFLFMSDGNSISADNLLAQLEIERGVVASDVSTILERSPQNQLGISSPANLIAQGIFLSAALQTAPEMGPPGAPPGQQGQDMQALQGALINAMLSLDIDQMETIIAGGTIEIELPWQEAPFEVSFKRYDPSYLGGYLETSPFADVLGFLLSTDFDPSNGSASKSIISVLFEEGHDADTYLSYEQTLEQIGKDVEGQHEGLDIRPLGDQLVNKAIEDASGQNIAMIMSIAFALVIIILAFVYRSVTDTFINLIALVFAIIWVFGFGSLMGYNFNPAITTVPVLIIGLGIDYGIHYNMRYREELRKGEDVRTSIMLSGATVGVAILLTTVTTLVGFLSNTSSNVESIQQFGILCAVGIISSFIVMLTFFPAVKTLLDLRKERAGKQVVPEKRDPDGGWGWAMQKRLPKGKEMVCASGVCTLNRAVGLGALLSKKPAYVLLALLFVTTIGAYEGAQLEARFDFRDFLPEDLEVTETTNILFDEFNFSRETAYILVEGGITHPTIYNQMALAEKKALESDYAVLSEAVESPHALITSMITPYSFRYHPEFSSAWYSTYDTDGDGLIDDNVGTSDMNDLYDMLFAMEPDAAVRVVHGSGDAYDAAVLRIPVNSRDGVLAEEGTRDMQHAADTIDSDALDRVVVTGGPPVQYEVLRSINSSQIKSLLITFVLSFFILSALYIYLKRSYLLGTVTLLTLVFVIIWTAGSMHLLGIPLNVVTVTIAAITVGLGIDYSIHVSQRFLEDIAYLDDVDCALCVTMNHTGSALFGSALTTVMGFGLLSLSIIPPLSQFGQVTALSITFAFLASVFVLPTFIRLWYIYGNKRSRDRSRGTV